MRVETPQTGFFLSCTVKRPNHAVSSQHIANLEESLPSINNNIVVSGGSCSVSRTFENYHRHKIPSPVVWRFW